MYYLYLVYCTLFSPPPSPFTFERPKVVNVLWYMLLRNFDTVVGVAPSPITGDCLD